MSIKRSALLSIKPRFANLLLSGEKVIELRKRAPGIEPGSLVIVYSSSPVCSLVGVLQIREVIRTTPSNIWEKFQEDAGISQEEFWSYYGSSNIAEGLVVDRADAFDQALPLPKIRSVWPGFMPPQSFRYIDTRLEDTKMRLKLDSYPGQEIVLSKQQAGGFGALGQA